MKRQRTETVTYNYKVKKEYGFFHLLFDFILTIITGGIWLIWLLIRHLRNA